MKAKIFVGPAESGKTRVALMISEFINKEKVDFISARNLKKKNELPHFFFSEIPDDTELLIIDDCPKHFDYGHFGPVEDLRPYGGDLKFKIRKERRGKNEKIITVPFLIFTTETLDPKWLNYGCSFTERFEVIEFPISKSK